MNDPYALNKAMEAANAYTKEHLVELARELVQWQDTGLLKGYHFGILKDILFRVSHERCLSLAESMVKDHAIRKISGEVPALVQKFACSTCTRNGKSVTFCEKLPCVNHSHWVGA